MTLGHVSAGLARLSGSRLARSLSRTPFGGEDGAGGIKRCLRRLLRPVGGMRCPPRLRCSRHPNCRPAIAPAHAPPCGAAPYARFKRARVAAAFAPCASAAAFQAQARSFPHTPPRRRSSNTATPAKHPPRPAAPRCMSLHAYLIVARRGDVTHPRQRLVAALLNDLEVPHLGGGNGGDRGGELGDGRAEVPCGGAMQPVSGWRRAACGRRQLTRRLTATAPRLCATARWGRRAARRPAQAMGCGRQRP